MKFPAPCLFAATAVSFVISSNSDGQEKPLSPPAIQSAVVIGTLPDGTPAPPAPKPELPKFKIETTQEIQKEQHRITMHKVSHVPLPDPPPPEPILQNMDRDARLAEAAKRISSRAVKHAFISATVFNHKKTFVRWRPDGPSGREFTAWSNIDFNHLTGFSIYQVTRPDGTTQKYSLMMAIGNAAPREVSALRDGPPLSPLDQGPSFVVTYGDMSDSAALEIMTGLHTLYKTEGTTLKTAWEGRQRAQKEHQAELKRNPPKPQNVETFYWRKKSR